MEGKSGGLTIRYGFHPSPFGLALVMATDRGLAGLAFADDEGGRDACFEDMARALAECGLCPGSGGDSALYRSRLSIRTGGIGKNPFASC